jgi:(p)ppGpp synthase/HD superfamily hydrolase
MHDDWSGERWTRVVAAVELAFALHADQRRKQGGAPYIGHLLAVAAIVTEDGGDEDQIVAALLHDAPEDQGGQRVLTDIRRRFGPRVAGIVDACTDTYENPKPPWRPRKEAWLARLPERPPESWRVALADKLHNVRSVTADVRRYGLAALDVFSGGRDGTVWYYRAAADALAQLEPGPLADELVRAVADLESLAGAAPAD